MDNPSEEENASLKREEATSPEEEKEEEEKRDDEGLLLKYDVIVCGTGLVQGIVASALVRAGKSVLHCDGAEVYGELDAVWNLDGIAEQKEHAAKDAAASSSDNSRPVVDNGAIPLSPKGGTASLIWHAQTKRTNFGIQVGTAVQTPYGKGTVQELSPTSLAVSIDNWTLADGKSPMAYFGIENTDEDYLAKTHKIQSLRSIHAQNILNNGQRYLALDATPSFVLAAGRAVQGMLASNVADYLEFKSIDGLYWLEQQESSQKMQQSLLSRVPCNKSDVFATKLLKPMDKRRLMKFLQLTMDYATQLSAAEELLLANAKSETYATNEVAETEVQSLNERHLNQGRSLARPQNKAVATEDLRVLQECMQEGVTFDDFLSRHHKLSPKLRALVRYALALETQDSSTSSSSLSQGMSSLRHHLQALGRFGTTAFLVPMYGSGELSQAFCRSAAVFGATYLLRRAPIGIQPPAQQEQQTDEQKEEGQSHEIGVWIAGYPSEDYYGGPPSSRKEKAIRCDHVVVPVDALQSATPPPSDKGGKRILRRISVLTGKLIRTESNNNNEQRHVIFVPPQTIGNSHVIHCVILDDSTQVSPAGCTLLHMTTTIHEDANEDPTSLLEKAFELVISAKQTQDDIDEIYSVTYSHKLHQPTEDGAQSLVPGYHDLPEGVHICHHTGQVLTADVAFEQAQKIFQTICPGKEFLGLSDELDAKIKERAAERGYEDDERLMLESALGMIGAAEEKSKEDEVSSSAKEIVDEAATTPGIVQQEQTSNPSPAESTAQS